jgi:hypothetical protein
LRKDLVFSMSSSIKQKKTFCFGWHFVFHSQE